MGLGGVELRRFVARRAIQLAAIVSFVGIALLTWGIYAAATPLSAEELERAESEFEAAQQDWEENGQEWVAECETAQAQESERSGGFVDFGCDTMAPQREWYVPEPPVFDLIFADTVGGGFAMLAFVLIFAGITFVAAEFSTGSMGTWLTFRPRRSAVFLSKLAAATAAGLVISIVWTAVLGFSLWGGYRLASGSAVQMGADEMWVLARTALLGPAMTAIGVGLSFVLRHTAAAFGAVIGYFLVIDTTILSNNLISGAARWTMLTNVSAWIKDGALYWINECTISADLGTVCESVERTVSLTQGGLFVLVVTLVALAAGWLSFRWRDV